MLSTRLVAYQPNGPRIGVLPDPAGHSGHLPVNGVSALKVDYFKGSEGSDALANPVEIALEVSAGGAWVEPANARFMRLVRDRDGVDKSGLWSFAMPGYGHMLTWACVLPAKTPSEANTDEDGKRKFLSANAGTILKTIIDEARALDPRVLEGLTYDFTTSRDSSGALWSKIITIYYEPGLGLDSIIGNLADQGVMDWEMQGRTLRVFNPDTGLARKLPAVRIHDMDTAAAPMKGTLEGLKHLVLLKGDDGKTWTRENVSAPTPWGKTISFITQGGVKDEGTAATLIQAELDAGARERVQYTRSLELTDQSPTPFVDYRPGDFITARNANGVWESMRVFALGLGLANRKHTVTLTLNDLFEDVLIRQAKRTKGIVGGAKTDGGSGTRPAPPEPGKRKPMAPAGLVMNSDHYFDARGAAHASVLASYAPATHGVDGLGLTIQAHELFGRQVGTTNPYRLLTSVEGETDTIGFSPLPVQTHWDFKVRAIAENGVPSDWSNTVRLELARDITPPPPPSTPKLTTRLGTIRVEWDGLTDLATPMPVDFDYCEVEITNHGGSGFISAGQLRALTGSDFTVLADLPYNTATQVRFVAVDSSGNRSAPSPIATMSTAPLVNTDLIGKVVAEANLGDNVVTARTIIAGAVTTIKLDALAVTAGKIATNAITTDKILAGSITTVKLEADAINASRLDALAITAKHTITGATIQTTATALRGVKINSSGLFAYNTAGEQTVSIYSASGNATVTGTIQTGLGDNQVVIRDNIFRGRPGMRLDTGSSHDVQPTIQSLGTGSSGFAAGDFVINGRETNINSSGRADLVLEHGGNFQLKQNWGSNSGIGIEKEGQFIKVRGKLDTLHNAHTQLHHNSYTITNGGSLTVTFGAPVPSGTRRCMATVRASDPVSQPIVTSEQGAASNKLYMARNTAGTTTVSVLFYWAG